MVNTFEGNIKRHEYCERELKRHRLVLDRLKLIFNT